MLAQWLIQVRGRIGRNQQSLKLAAAKENPQT
jgi:hypothetical protein